MAYVKTKTKTKDPDEVLDYKLDWSDWLAETPTTEDTITSSTYTLSSTRITKDSDSNDTDSTTIWLSGGTAGEEYGITNRVATNGSRTAEASFTIQVRSV
jgi:hypothetical protein